MSILAFYVYQSEQERRVIKEELIELSKIKYGLFSADEWKVIITDIVAKKLEEFELEPKSKEELRKRISAMLHKVVDGFEARYEEKKSKNLLTKIEGGIVSLFKAFEKIREDIPEFTDQILVFMEDPRNKAVVEGFITRKYIDEMSANIDYTVHDGIISKYNYLDRADAICWLTEKLEAHDSNRQPYTVSLLILALLASLYALFVRGLAKAEYLMLALTSLVLLIMGLVLPMMELDARIGRMNFILFGEPVTFGDQVLYFRSKSILEVVQLLLTKGNVDLLLVGILIFTFSVLFPLSKLISTLIYLYIPKIKSNKVIQFLIFKTGKWSMADVMVIAIFMAYIGFSGVITEQLAQIDDVTPNIDIFTTNMSRLRIGFFAFTAFAVLSLIIAHRLQYNTQPVQTTPQPSLINET